MPTTSSLSRFKLSLARREQRSCPLSLSREQEFSYRESMIYDSPVLLRKSIFLWKSCLYFESATPAV